MNPLDSFFKPDAIEAPRAIEQAALRSDRFRLEREHDWKRLDAILRRMEGGRLGKVPDEELLALPALYRTAASSLAIARETSLDAATLAYLESLVQRAWFQVYGPRSSLWDWLRRFFGGGWSASVRAIWPEICISLAVMVAGTIVGWMLVARDKEWYYSLVPTDLTDTRVPGASRAVLQESLKGVDNVEGLSFFSAYLFSHNAQVAIVAFATGFAFGIPSMMALLQNMATLGAMLWLFDSAGLGVDFAAWLSIHGTTEMYAILLAGAAGLHVGRNMVFPGNRAVVTAMAESGRRAAQVMAGVVLMLVVAGMLESFARQLIVDTGARFAVGGAMLLFWTGYFFLFRRQSTRGQL